MVLKAPVIDMWMYEYAGGKWPPTAEYFLPIRHLYRCCIFKFDKLTKISQIEFTFINQNLVFITGFLMNCLPLLQPTIRSSIQDYIRITCFVLPNLYLV
jgi:hypothetical protein